MNLKELDEKAIRSYEAYRKRGKEIDDQIDLLLKKKARLKWHSLLEKGHGLKLTGGFIKPLVEIIQKKLGAKKIEIYGPFGLCSSTTVYWLKEKEKSICDRGNVLGSLTLITSGKGYAIRNERKETNKYAPGTIAAMNGMNYKTIEITKVMDVKWLLNFVKRK